MKSKLIFLAIIAVALGSCVSKPEKEKVDIQSESVERKIKVVEQLKSGKPNWSEDNYGYLKYELDSLGLKYTTMKGKEFDEIYRNPEKWESTDFEGYSNSYRKYAPNEEYLRFGIDSTQTFQVGVFTFEAVYDENMSFSENIGNWGGIRQMTISKNSRHLQTMTDIKDIFGFGVVQIEFYDFNLDGHIDMRFVLAEGKAHFHEYFLFNPQKQIFKHAEDWDYIRPDYYNFKEKQFLTIPYGTAGYGDFGLYQINGSKLRQLKKIYYHSMLNTDESFITVVDINP